MRAVGVPVVAPSANLSKHVSPTSAAHVLDDFDGKIPLILDGGACTGVIESTVCDVTGEYPVILRPGLVTREMIERARGQVRGCARDARAGREGENPGMLYKHYSPRCRTLLFPEDGRAEAEDAFPSGDGGGEPAHCFSAKESWPTS